ncbi:class I adenylate-forming enzyme family protein [Polymorphospora rubra]|uniref:AMP-dependent synthetase and ligase n=1 Tax=Polymorphospora rubra TaxID=338584 RepID=A0A810N5H5_9ACTN|nr:class I adenylate-forming enzyme family protein [Polymorphospora rubra]BCJ67439.1 AMP-dependent synthetase and ligase [Polymorphospora rubra]
MVTLLHDLLDRAAADRPDRIAVGRGPDSLTYAELSAASRRLAYRLAGHGVRRGDRVVVQVPAGVLVPALLYACSRVGAVFSLVSEQAPAVALAHVLTDAEPVLLVSDRADAAPVAAGLAVRCVGLAELAGTGDGGPHGEPGPPPLAVDPVCLIYTSGSTGMPKAVVSTHAQVVFAAGAIGHELGYRPTDVVYCALPLSFDYGMYQIFLSTLAGARLQLGSPADAGPGLARQLVAHRATVLPAVPSLARGLARLLSRPDTAVPALRLLTNTGAAMPPEVLRDLRARIPSLRVQLMFGLTECKRAAIMPVDEDLRRPGAAGRALPGTEILIVDADGRSVPPGTTGEIVIRGPHVMAGYWRRPELTAQRFPRTDGLFPVLRTGDYGRLDADGYLYFVGRRDDIYKERGTRVSVTEVEAAAHRIPQVEAAAVLPPGPGSADDSATLFVVTRLSPQEVLAALRAELDELKTPRTCLVVPELPLTRNGKVDRADLHRQWSAAAHA